MNSPANRDISGKFKPGMSGNPTGRPKNPLMGLIREKTNNGEEVVEKVLEVMRTSKKESSVLWACEFLRDTGWHKPITPVKGTDEDDNGYALPFIPTYAIPGLIEALKSGPSCDTGNGKGETRGK